MLMTIFDLNQTRKNSVHNYLLNLELFRNTLTLYLFQRFGKDFEDLKEIWNFKRDLKLSGYWEETQKKLFTLTVTYKIYEKYKEINQHDEKNLISVFAYFLATSTEVLFLNKRLNARLCVQPSLRFFQ